jgi:hypothetical protein
MARIHTLYADKELTDKELREILDALDCYKVVRDSKTFVYHFFEN